MKQPHVKWTTWIYNTKPFWQKMWVLTPQRMELLYMLPEGTSGARTNDTNKGRTVIMLINEGN